MQDKSVDILSQITVFTKYSKHRPDLQRRETWAEIVDRNRAMHVKKYPHLESQINTVYRDFVLPKKVLPSMRSMQFGGRPIEVAPNRIFNCAYQPLDHPDAFSENMFLLLGGTGVGYSVQSHHIAALPPILGPGQDERRYVVGDSIEGWADAVKMLIESYLYGKDRIRFDFREIRPKGAKLVTSGGKAPGPQPLIDCLHAMTGVLDEALRDRGIGAWLKPIEAHDLMCHIADAVLAGGIRRAAMIALFSHDDEEMLTAKHGEWWELNPQRGRANNSAMINRKTVTREHFDELWAKVEASGSGEPGIYLTNDLDLGTNPCAEIGLQPHQFCNVTEVNASDVKSQKDLDDRCAAAAFIGTLQAGYTDFHYLRKVWRDTTEDEALIGVGMTGIGSGAVLPLDLEQAAEVVKSQNELTALEIGINVAARTTTVKPAGTTSMVLGCGSGIHAWHNDYYIRRMRVGKDEAIYHYLATHHPELVEDEFFRPETIAVVSVPQKAPEGSILRHESPMDLLDRVSRFNREWVRAGHRDGKNSHNVSCTVSVKDDQWQQVGDWMWEHREEFNGISVLPYDGGTYTQAPFEDITAEEYERLVAQLSEIDLTQVVEVEDQTDLRGEQACAGGSCEIV